MIVWGRETTSSTPTALAPSTLAPTGGALTWTEAGHRQWVNAFSPSTKAGIATIYYIVNAASTSASFVASVQEAGGPIANVTMTVEFSLYEFSGVQVTTGGGALSVVDTTAFFLKDVVSGGSLIGGTITPTHNNDLIIAAYSGDSATGSNVASGASYTLGVDATIAILGQAQYKLNASTGAQSFLFNSNPATFFGGFGAAFKPFVAPPPAGISRHKGYVF